MVDVVLFGGFGVVYAAAFGVASLSEYMDGRCNGGQGFLGVLVFLGLAGLSLLWLLVLLARILIAWPGHVQDRRRLAPLYAMVFLGLAMWVALPFTGLCPPGCVVFTRGFERHMRENMDLAAVRNWLNTLDPGICEGEFVDLYDYDDLAGYDGPKSHWPETIAWPAAITRFNPHYVQLMKTEIGQSKIRLTWGGALGHWGVEIGPAGMEVPPTLERKGREFGPPGQRDIVYDTGEYRLPLAPGAYVWHEIQ